MSAILQPTRRALMRSAVAGAALTASGHRAEAGSLDLADPAQALALSRRLDAPAADGERVLSIGRGTLYAAPDPTQSPLPLLGLAVVETSAAWALGDGRYGLTTKRLVLFTSLGGADCVVSFKNPFSGVLCRPYSAVETLHEEITGEHGKSADRGSHWSMSGGRIIRTATGVEHRSNPLDPQRWPHQSSGVELRTSYVAARSAPLAQLRTDRPLVVEAAVTEAAPWQPWMLMGASHGGVVFETFTRTASGLAGLGSDLAALVERDHPDVLTPTAGQTLGREDTYVQYSRAGRPLSLDQPLNA